MGRQATLRRQAKQNQAQKQNQANQNKRGSRGSKKPNRKLSIWPALSILLIILAAIGIVFLAQGKLFPSPASAVSTQPDAAVDGITCDANEGAVQHIHAHVTIYINGSQATIPANVGIATDGSCYYWLHTHQITGDSGVIHIESPVMKTFTLGNFVDIWHTQFSQLSYPVELNSTSGWQVYVNGTPFNGSWRDVPMTSHAAITIAYNSQNIKPDTRFNFIPGE